MSNQPVKATLVQDHRKDSSALLIAVASVLFMGLGQFLNRQWAKGLLFLAIPLLFVGIEFGTGSWDKMDQGYHSDYVNYFGQLALSTLDDQNSALTTVVTKDAVLSNPMTDLVAPSQGGKDIDGAFVQVTANYEGQPHGYLIPESVALALVSAKTGSEVSSLSDVELAQLGGLIPAWGVPFTAKLGELEGKSLAMTPGGAQLRTDAKLEGTQPLVRVRYDMNLDGNDLGSYYEYVAATLAQNAVGPVPIESEVRYPVRDYGGYFTRGIWGMVTLGALVIGNDYRGLTMEAFNADKPWASADDSSKLLARGLIASVVIAFLLFAWLMNILDAYKSRKQYLKTGTVQGFVEYVKDLWERSYVWILIAPSMVLIAFFTVIPFVYTFLCSFTNWTYKIYLIQMLVSWKGIAEYLTVFAEPAWLSVFFQVFGWTIIWALASSVTVYVLGFAHALVIESPLVRGKKFWRTILIIPWAFPALVSLLAFRNVFDKDGLMNQILLATGMMKPLSDLLYGIGLEGKPDDIIFWFDPPYNANLAKFVAIMVNLWVGAPYFMMLMTGIMSTIPADRYEAAMIDGASAFQKFRYITLPLVVTATIPAMVMTVTFNFNNFGALYFLTGGGPAWLLENLPDALRTWTNSMPGQTDILMTWVYKISFNANSQLYNKAAVYTVFIFLILGIFSVVNMRLTKAFDEEGEE